MVTLRPPAAAALGRPVPSPASASAALKRPRAVFHVSVGVSYEKISVAVPARVARVRESQWASHTPVAATATSAVSDVHRVDAAEVPPNLATEMFMTVASFMLKSTVPKFDPDTVTEVPPSVGALGMVMDEMTGLSYVKTSESVPASAELLNTIVTFRPRPIPGGTWARSDESETQSVTAVVVYAPGYVSLVPKIAMELE
mmetsp:Transcript_37264/g.88152  ORF Transcript_37264/g.88152 Transcript_37264/m.88152 type:complete len:200 (-) Transcript_37264:3359-3958(-)